MLATSIFDVDSNKSWVCIDNEYIETTPRGGWFQIDCGDVDKVAFVECMTVENIHTLRYMAKECTKELLKSIDECPDHLIIKKYIEAIKRPRAPS